MTDETEIARIKALACPQRFEAAGAYGINEVTVDIAITNLRKVLADIEAAHAAAETKLQAALLNAAADKAAAETDEERARADAQAASARSQAEQEHAAVGASHAHWLAADHTFGQQLWAMLQQDFGDHGGHVGVLHGYEYEPLP